MPLSPCAAILLLLLFFIFLSCNPQLVICCYMCTNTVWILRNECSVYHLLLNLLPVQIFAAVLVVTLKLFCLTYYICLWRSGLFVCMFVLMLFPIVFETFHPWLHQVSIWWVAQWKELKMPAKKKKKSGKLSKMTEEERIAYEDAKRLAEEEMRKKKEDMLSQFLKVRKLISDLTL